MGVAATAGADKDALAANISQTDRNTKENEDWEIFAEKVFHRAPDYLSVTFWRSVFLLTTATVQINRADAATAKNALRGVRYRAEKTE